ncbi:hypothetical protein [Pyruvatibacter sp.]|uniref:hypothetical protein n=1 Tax=Pyruvatibacter sp. TaxID=1981328 RepID=UPI0032EAFEAE
MTTAQRPGPDWPGIEHAYRDSDLSVAELTALFGITQNRLYTRARQQGWPPRRPRLPVRHEVYEAGAKSDDLSVAMLSRLSGALAKHINELERAVQSPDRTDDDREREAKVLGALAQVLDKLMALATRLDDRNPAKKETAADHDRIVAAIAERVARLGNDRTADALLSKPHAQGG